MQYLFGGHSLVFDLHTALYDLPKVTKVKRWVQMALGDTSHVNPNFVVAMVPFFL